MDVRQVTGPGQELEVIIESDTRSEYSEQHKGSEESGGGVVEDVECQITVSKSSQQLRKQFFGTASDPESKELQSCVQVDLETRVKMSEEDSKQPNTSSTQVKDETIVKTGYSGKHNESENKKCKIGDNVMSCERQYQTKTESRVLTKQTAISEVATLKNGKSPILSRKEKKSSSIKLSHNKSEPSISKLSSEEKDTSNQGEPDTLKASISQNVKNESKSGSSVEKKEKNLKKPSSSCDSVNEIPAGSKSSVKNTNLQEPVASGKPPSGSIRQRKKATSKTPNKDSIDLKKEPGDKR